MARDFPLDAWYAAGWQSEISRTPLARTICEVPIVFYRKLDGTPVALEDACLHRLFPLSMGRLEGDVLACGYHGMAFDPQGKCVRMPIPSEKPSANKARSFPLFERHRLVWIWMGNPALADPASIPDLHWADDPNWAGLGAHLDIQCDYRLVLDNLMDLTHETFVHTTSIGHENIIEVPFEVTHDGPDVTLSRWMIDVEAPPFLAMQLKQARDLPPDHVDRWQIIHFTAPSTIVIDVGVSPTGTGAPKGDRSKGISGRVLNTVTPQTVDRCYYFFAYVRCYALDDQELTAKMREANVRIFMEDKTVLEAQQERMNSLPNMHLANFSTDQGSLWARRAIDHMMSAERS